MAHRQTLVAAVDATFLPSAFRDLQPGTVPSKIYRPEANDDTDETFPFLQRVGD